LPSIDEFRSDVERCKKCIARTLVLTFGGVFLFMLLAVTVSAVAEESLGSVLPKFMPPAAFLIFIPLMLFGCWRADQRYKKFATLTCPHCAKSLVQQASIVIASRNCPHCGQKVIAGPHPTA
jgi:hypothetical protein